MVGLDLETTGRDPEEARIVSASLVEVGGGLPLRERAWLVDPGVEIPEGATEVHGITTERVRAEGLPTDAAIGEILTALDQALGTSRPLVIFNARYDLTVLDREALDVGEPFVLHIDRADADRHRAASLRGWPTRRGWHRDEYPPAATAEGGAGADVQFVPSSENESAGAVMRARLAPFCDGQPFVFGPVTA
jgi:hypothetical protein